MSLAVDCAKEWLFDADADACVVCVQSVEVGMTVTSIYSFIDKPSSCKFIDEPSLAIWPRNQVKFACRTQLLGAGAKNVLVSKDPRREELKAEQKQ